MHYLGCGSKSRTLECCALACILSGSATVSLLASHPEWGLFLSASLPWSSLKGTDSTCFSHCHSSPLSETELSEYIALSSIRPTFWVLPVVWRHLLMNPIGDSGFPGKVIFLLRLLNLQTFTSFLCNWGCICFSHPFQLYFLSLSNKHYLESFIFIEVSS